MTEQVGKRLSELDPAAAITGNEQVFVTQNEFSVRAALSAIATWIRSACVLSAGPGSITASSASTALTVTQTGAGHALVVPNGNVGIGVAAPNTKLEVGGDSGLRLGSGSPIALRIGDTTTGDAGGQTWNTTTDFAQLQLYSGDASMPVGASVRASVGAVMENTSGGASSLVFRTGASGPTLPERMRIDSVGCVGIGAPSGASQSWTAGGVSTKLNIVDTQSYTLGVIKAYANSVGSAGILALAKSRGTLGVNTTTQSGDSLGFLSFEGVNASNNVMGASYIQGSQDGAAGAWLPGRLQFFTSSGTGAPAERLRIDSAGKVGIGGTPTTKLEVFGSVGNLQVADTGNRLAYTRNGANYLSAAGASASMNYEAETHSFYNGAGTLERLRIDSSGLASSVDDAATNAVTRPLVLNHTTTGTAANGIGSGMAFQAESSTGALRASAYIDSVFTDATDASLASALAFSTRAGGAIAERMRIDSAGNVGVGVTPSAWRSNGTAIDLSAQGSLYSSVGVSNAHMLIGANVFLNSSLQYVYKASVAASYYQQANGRHALYSAPAGTAAAVISPTAVLSAELDKSLALQGASLQSGTGISFPATQNPSADANTLDDYREASYTATATGMTTSPTGTVEFVRVGRQVTMQIPTVSGTSNATTFTLTGGPTTMRPTTVRRCPVRVQDNGGAAIYGQALIGTDGVITLNLNPNGDAFTASGVKAVHVSSLSYII